MAKKPYKELLGNRIYVNVPKKDESKIIVDENTKEALQREMLKKMSKLKVYDVGDIVKNVKAGRYSTSRSRQVKRCNGYPFI